MSTMGPDEPFDDGHGSAIRLSNSPRRSPQIIQVLQSPVQSLHPQLQSTANSSHAPKDLGIRTLDFFDDSSDDGENSRSDPADTAPDIHRLERRGSATKKTQSHPMAPPLVSLASQCEARPIKLSPQQDGYQPLSTSIWADAPDQVPDQAETASTSFNGSVDELLPSGGLHSSPRQHLRGSRISSGRTPRPSSQAQHSEDTRQSSASPIRRPSAALGAYAIAHEITLQALMRDEETMDKGLQGIPLAPIHSLDRRSMLPAALSFKDDPRSPKIRDFSSQAPSVPGSVTTNGKRVHVVPPPIDIIDAGHRTIPNDIVRTPYPFSPEHERVHRKDLGNHQPPPRPSEPEPIAGSTESVLTLSLRSSHANGRPRRVTTITIPASNDFTTVRHSTVPGEKERHFRALDFDDAELFRQIRSAYRRLTGPWRLLSARSLSHISITAGSGDGGQGWLHEPRPPLLPARQGQNDSFSEMNLMRYFRRPGRVKGRYAFVHWAHRLSASASAPSLPQIRPPRPGEVQEAGWARCGERPEGLEFVVAWSAWRIVFVLLAVLAASTAAALLWTLLGKDAVLESTPAANRPWDGSSAGADAGFGGAGNRVTSGVLMGIGTLLLGLSGMAGWLGVSWLLM